ncbi:MAG: YqjF family protein [Fimbriiglobus sp.]
MAWSFLTARWSNLILANYAVPEDLLTPYLPPGVDLDRRDGQAWASLVGFQFLETRVLGIPWPGFRNFPEWNLRFYVKCGDDRGVCFVREFVPQRFVATVARLVYNEPYERAPTTMSIIEEAAKVSVEYTVTYGDQVHRLHATGRKPAIEPGPESTEAWFKEQVWGFGTTRGGRRLRYEVRHPTWSIYPIEEFDSDLDWARLYGPEWEPMNAVAPASVILAVGSRVTVSPHGRE